MKLLLTTFLLMSLSSELYAHSTGRRHRHSRGTPTVSLPPVNCSLDKLTEQLDVPAIPEDASEMVAISELGINRCVTHHCTTVQGKDFGDAEILVAIGETTAISSLRASAHADICAHYTSMKESRVNAVASLRSAQPEVEETANQRVTRIVADCKANSNALLNSCIEEHNCSTDPVAAADVGLCNTLLESAGLPRISQRLAAAERERQGTQNAADLEAQRQAQAAANFSMTGKKIKMPLADVQEVFQTGPSAKSNCPTSGNPILRERSPNTISIEKALNGNYIKDHFGYSTFWRFCEGELDKPWDQMVSGDSAWQGTSNAWKNSTCQFEQNFRSKMSDMLTSGDGSTISQIKAEWLKYKNMTITYRDKIQDCHALLKVSHHSDYGSAGDNEGDDDDDSGKVASSVNPALICKTKGTDTQDFEKCKSLITAYDGAFIGKTVMKGVQDFQTVDKNMDRQTDLQTKAAQDGGLTTQDAMGAQRDSIKDQASQAYVRATFDAGKVVMLKSMLSDMPTKGSLKRECNKAYPPAEANNIAAAIQLSIENVQEDYKKLFLVINNTIPLATNAFYVANYGDNWNRDPKFTAEMQHKVSDEINKLGLYIADDAAEVSDEVTVASIATAPAPVVVVEVDDADADADADPAPAASESVAKNSHCEALFTSHRINLAINGKMRALINREVMKAGTDAIANFATGAILDKRAKQVENAMNNIKDLEVPEFIGGLGEDEIVELCEAEPEQAVCSTPEARRAIQFANGGAVTFGGNTAGGTSGLLNADGSPADKNALAANSKTNRTGVGSSFGTEIAGINKDNGFETNAPGAGTVKKGAGGGAEASGGGGGAGGGAAAPGGGAGGGARAPGSVRGRRGKAIRYGGGAGGLYGGGRGGRAKKAKGKASNPFAKMFGKKGRKKGGTLGFRNPASIGKKGGSIFNMISKRYSNVNKSKRLLEYEKSK